MASGQRHESPRVRACALRFSTAVENYAATCSPLRRGRGAEPTPGALRAWLRWAVTARPSPLLCELHAHTTWSDGVLTIGEAVDLYGAAGFDFLCITDHVVRPGAASRAVEARGHADYLAEIDAEAARARRDHRLLLLPGL